MCIFGATGTKYFYIQYLYLFIFYFHRCFSLQSLPCIVTNEDRLEGVYPKLSAGFTGCLHATR